jgi:hypothetical protein
MEKKLAHAVAILVFLALCPIAAICQRMVSVRPAKPVICYYSTQNRPDHIGESDRFTRMRAMKSARTQTSVFEVEYINFPPEAQAAFQYAIEIWESELTSSVPIRVTAEWKPLGSGVLGQALWGRAYANFGGAQHINTFYPVALAEKISGRALNDDAEADIVASFSSNTPWYYGTDGNTPTGKMDLVTIVLHEIAHGLGFTDSFEVKGTEASVGLPDGELTIPFVFDLYVESDSTKKLCYEYQAPSAELASALQSNNLFFNSPMSVTALNSVRPELFAPKTFDGGSSVSHLDEATFNAAGDANRLMTPHIALAESIHDPGSVLRGVLSDIGWVYTHIDHQELKDTERKDGQPYAVKVTIRSDNGYDHDEVELHYSTDGKNFTVVTMAPTGVADEFQSWLPGSTTDRTYAYYLSVVDEAGRSFTNPGMIETIGKRPEQGMLIFRIGTDETPPVVAHEPVEYIFEGETDLKLEAEVTDNVGIKEVLVEYTVNDGPLQTMVMEESMATDEYKASLNFPALSIGDHIQYRLLARDLATNENITRLPEQEFFSVTVTGIKPVQDSYSSNFNLPSADFFGHNFHITTPDGFGNGAIHSDHPYSNGSGPNEESNFTFQLQIPIRIGTTNPVIKFDEVVLVEPGESDSEFGDPNFFDYVVVEGSADGGETWKTFADGYDSRDNSVWLSRYNSDILNFNSRTVGTPDMFRKRTINMLENGNFSEGDEVIIRFRLFADALAHGWGWAIDNLSIQGPVTDVEKGVLPDFSIYPVPVREDLVIEILDPERGPVQIQISDLQGRIVFNEKFEGITGDFRKSIPTGFLKDGMYIIKAASGDRIYSRRFVKLKK